MNRRQFFRNAAGAAAWLVGKYGLPTRTAVGMAIDFGVTSTGAAITIAYNDGTIGHMGTHEFNYDTNNDMVLRKMKELVAGVLEGSATW